MTNYAFLTLRKLIVFCNYFTSGIPLQEVTDKGSEVGIMADFQAQLQ